VRGPSPAHGDYAAMNDVGNRTSPFARKRYPYRYPTKPPSNALTDAPVRCVRSTSTTEFVAALKLPRADVTYDLRRSGIGFASTPMVLMQVPGRRDYPGRAFANFPEGILSYAKRRDTARSGDWPFPGHSGRRDVLPGGGSGLDFMGGGVVRRGVATAPPHDGTAAWGEIALQVPGPRFRPLTDPSAAAKSATAFATQLPSTRQNWAVQTPDRECG